MKKLELTKNINAPIQKVWIILWNQTAIRNGRHLLILMGEATIQIDRKVGGKILFLDTLHFFTEFLSG